MRFFLLLLTVALYALSQRANAAEIFPAECGLAVVGPIDAGDDTKFHSKLAALFRTGCDSDKPLFIYLYSEGGNFGAALEIGRQIHRLHLSTVAPTLVHYSNRGEPDMRPRNGPRRCQYLPGSKERSQAAAAELLNVWSPKLLSAMKNGTALPKPPENYGDLDPVSGKGDPRCTCASACFFIWAAGDERLGDVILVHRPYFEQAYFAGLEASGAEAAYKRLAGEARPYLRELGVQDTLIDRLFSIDSQHASYLTAEELSLLRVQSYISELKIAKCGPEAKPGDKPTGELRGGSLNLPSWASALTTADKEELLRGLERNLCWLKVQAQSRRSAVSLYLQESAAFLPDAPLYLKAPTHEPTLPGGKPDEATKPKERQVRLDAELPKQTNRQPPEMPARDRGFAEQLDALDGADFEVQYRALAGQPTDTTNDALKSSPLFNQPQEWHPSPSPAEGR